MKQSNPFMAWFLSSLIIISSLIFGSLLYSNSQTPIGIVFSQTEPSVSPTPSSTAKTASAITPTTKPTKRITPSTSTRSS